MANREALSLTSAPTLNISPPVPGGFVLPFFNRGPRQLETDEQTPSSQALGKSDAQHLPLIHHLSDTFRGHLVACLGEFLGTFLFLFFAFGGTQVANSSDASSSESGPGPATLLYIALAFAFSLSVNAWAFFRVSGGLFNPAVTLGMCLVGALTYVRGSLLIVSQLLGAISSSLVVSALLPGPLSVQTTLSVETSPVRGLFIEMFLTTELIFAIFMLATEKHRATFIAPVGIGLALFIAELTGVKYTGGSLNPARSFGPSVALGSFEPYHWVYWLGPILGAILASVAYKIIKVLEYETANPSPDPEERMQVQQADHSHRSKHRHHQHINHKHRGGSTEQIGHLPSRRGTDGAMDYLV